MCLHFCDEDVCRSGHVSTRFTSTHALDCDGVGVVVSVKIRSR